MAEMSQRGIRLMHLSTYHLSRLKSGIFSMDSENGIYHLSLLPSHAPSSSIFQG